MQPKPSLSPTQATPRRDFWLFFPRYFNSLCLEDEVYRQMRLRKRALSIYNDMLITPSDTQQVVIFYNWSHMTFQFQFGQLQLRPLLAISIITLSNYYWFKRLRDRVFALSLYVTWRLRTFFAVKLLYYSFSICLLFHMQKDNINFTNLRDEKKMIYFIGTESFIFFRFKQRQ